MHFFYLSDSLNNKHVSFTLFCLTSLFVSPFLLCRGSTRAVVQINSKSFERHFMDSYRKLLQQTQNVLNLVLLIKRTS